MLPEGGLVVVTLCPEGARVRRWGRRRSTSSRTTGHWPI